MSNPRPNPANVPGDFYVEDKCCTLCEVPFVWAPDLFGRWPDASKPEHCYIKRQPATPDDVDAMLSVILCAEFDCIRYRGHDRAIQSQLVEIGKGMVCESLLADLKARAEQMKAEARSRPRLPWWRRFFHRS